MRKVACLAHVVLCLAFLPFGAEARKKTPPLAAAAKDRVTELTETGLAALKQGQFAQATQAFLDGYRLVPLPKWLFYLAQVAQAEKKTVDARDFLRRFLADATVEDSDPLRKEAMALLETLPVIDAGELQVTGPRGASIHVDDRFVGSLPLSQPLLLPPGPHRIVAELGKWQAASEVKTRLARQVELRFKLGSDVAVVTLPPAILLLDKTPDKNGSQAIFDKVQTTVSRESYAVVPRAAVQMYAKDLESCLPEASCLRQAGQRLLVEFALSVQVRRDGGNLQAELTLRDTAVGLEHGVKKVGCHSCDVAGLLPAIGQAAGSLMSAAAGRDRADVEFISTPDGATVFLNDTSIGPSPIKLTLFAGTYNVKIRKPGHVDFQETVEVRNADPLTVSAALTELAALNEPSPSLIVKKAPLPKKRPLWRWIAGGAAVGAGVLVGGFGLSALVQNGSAIEGICPENLGAPKKCQFATTVPGIALTASGGALVVAGAVLWAWPPPK